MAQPGTLLGKLLILVVASLAAGATAEFVLRLLPAPWRYQSPPEAALMVEHPVLGYALRPNASAHWTREHRSIHVEISSEGLRDDPLSRARVASFRALAVGDSFTFGIGVERDEAWPEVLEREIAAHLGRSASVVNAGVPAYSARQIRLRALDLLTQFDPALVIAALYARSYWRVREPYVVFGGVLVMSPEVPRLAIAASGDLISSPFRAGALRDADVWLKDHLYLPARILAVVGPRLLPQLTIPFDVPDRSAWTDRDYQPALDELAQLHAALAERGIPLVLLLVNHQEADGSFSPDELRYNAHVAQFCGARGLPLANPLSRFVAEGKGQPVFRTASDMHWTPLAQQIAAQEVMRVLEARGLLLAPHAGDERWVGVSSLFEAFLAAARREPSAPAVLQRSADPHCTTYADLVELCLGYARALADRVPDRSLVPILAGKSATSIALSLACSSTGRPFAWLNKRLRAPQIIEIANSARAEVVVADAPAFLSIASAIREDPTLRAIRWLGIADGTRAGSTAALAQAVRLLSEYVDVSVLTPVAGSGGTLIGPIAPDAFVCCLFTSGSTGRQKGVMVDDRDLAARARSEVDWFELTDRDRLLSILPFSFDVGLNQLLSALAAGACLVIEESWLPVDVLKAVARDAVTGISGVPSIWRDLLASGTGFDHEGVHRSLRYVTISGGSLSLDEQERLRERLPGVAIFKTYGQTETFRSASLRPEELALRPGSVGRAYAGTRVLVLREDGSACLANEVGEVVHVGLGTMLGYLGNGSNAGKIRALPAELGGDRAVFTGDYGFLDPEGYLFLKGRMDAMVKIAGNRVYPEEAADQLRELEGVREAEVLAVAQEGADPRLVGFVVSDGSQELTSDSIRKLALARLPAHMLPTKTLVLPELPRLANGKIDRRALDELARRERTHSP